MNIEELGKITAIKVPGAIFASANSGTFIELTNYNQVTFLIESGEGTAGNTTVTLEAKVGEEGTPVSIPFQYLEKGLTDYDEKPETGQVFSIGGAAGASKYALVTVTSPMLASGDYDRVAIKTTAVASSTVTGAIYAIQSQPRYSE